jgi:hypothetical protein
VLLHIVGDRTAEFNTRERVLGKRCWSVAGRELAQRATDNLRIPHAANLRFSWMRFT